MHWARRKSLSLALLQEGFNIGMCYPGSGLRGALAVMPGWDRSGAATSLPSPDAPLSSLPSPAHAARDAAGKTHINGRRQASSPDMITSPVISLTLMRFTYPSQIYSSLSESSSCSFPSLALWSLSEHRDLPRSEGGCRSGCPDALGCHSLHLIG